MNDIILFLAGGYSFFVGLLLLLVSFFFGRRKSRLCHIAATLSSLIAVILIVVSITPIDLWWCLLLAVSTVLWILSLRSSLLSERWKLLAPRLILLCVASGVILELPWFLMPRLSSTESRRLIILADSLTAGLAEEDFTWPERLAQQVDYQIVDQSHVGAVVEDGLQMIESVSLEGDLVLIELGGNDLLGSTPPDEFQTNLERLLSQISQQRCAIVMFELPLPPFNYQIGYSQRSLARKYDVRLIPKRVMLRAIVGEGKTVDSIHLSSAGHQQMSELVEDLLRPAFP